jgi:hypothetical protein
VKRKKHYKRIADFEIRAVSWELLINSELKVPRDPSTAANIVVLETYLLRGPLSTPDALFSTNK